MLVRVEFQRTMSSALVRIVHTLSGGAWISADTVHCIRKVDRVFTALISVVDIGGVYIRGCQLSSVGVEDGAGLTLTYCVDEPRRTTLVSDPDRQTDRQRIGRNS